MRSVQIILFAVIASIAASGPARPDGRGETFTCHFGRYGKVIIDTRNPGSSITINGRRFAAQDGSYFYQTADGKIAVYFGPNMRFWDYNDIRDRHCIRRRNSH